MGRILLVEDDPVLGRGLCVNLESDGHQVSWAKRLDQARSELQNSRPELVLLDLTLPDGNGLELCTYLRRELEWDLPVIVLTARGDEDSVVRGFSSGANDYVRKPFGVRELSARIRVALRGSAQPLLKYGELRVSVDHRRVFFDDREITLNRKEFEIIKHLIMHAEKVVTREALVSISDPSGDIYDRTIDSHVSHIRTKLKQAQVQALQISPIYGIGYRLERK